MSDVTHTPEPWTPCEANGGKCICGLIWSKSADVVVATTPDENCLHQEHGDTSIGKDVRLANARRICACVNALVGLPTETIEKNAVREAMGATTLILQEVLRICRIASVASQAEALDRLQPMLEELLSGL